MYILAVPVLIVLLLMLALLLFLFGKWKTALVVIIGALALNKHTQTFPANISYQDSWEEETTEGPARLNVMTYNIAGMQTDELFEYLDTLNIDLLALQESETLPKKNRLTKHFPYHGGNSVFCKYPIRNFRQLSFEKGSPAWELQKHPVLNPHNYQQTATEIYVMQVELPQGKVNVVNLHLRSNAYSTARRQMKAEEEWSDGIGEYLRRIAYGYKVRKLQAELIREELAKTDSLPTIILGDFNDLSGSTALKILQGEELHNAWWEGGFGPGFTYDCFHLLLRLDHILYTPQLELEQVFIDTRATFSDHYPLRARFCVNF